MLTKKLRVRLERQMEDHLDEERNLIINKNPLIDHWICLYGCLVPTKQDAFKPLDAFIKADDGTKYSIKNLYEKNEDSESIRVFTDHLRKVAIDVFKDGKKIKKPSLFEVVINVSTLKKRFKEVDVDNLAKCVLDGLNGIAFDDDSQVSRLLCEKHVHPWKLMAFSLLLLSLLTKEMG